MGHEFVRRGMLVKNGSGTDSRHFRVDIAALEKISLEG